MSAPSHGEEVFSLSEGKWGREEGEREVRLPWLQHTTASARCVAAALCYFCRVSPGLIDEMNDHRYVCNIKEKHKTHGTWGHLSF